jgi:putative transposase
VVKRKKVARLLREWGFTRPAPRPHTKAQGRPFNVTASNVLWQTDLTSVWCGEDGWAYFTAVIEGFDRSVRGSYEDTPTKRMISRASGGTYPEGAARVPAFNALVPVRPRRNHL